jgi:diacylglycerol O-acyltransferase
MQYLSGLDGAFLSLETEATPMHVGSLHLFDAPAGARKDFRETVKKMIAGRLHLAPVFRRRLAEMPLNFANPVWVEGDVDLDFHIRNVLLPLPGGQRELQDCVGDLHGRLLDRTRPLWMLYIIDGLASGQKGYYIKVHHALLDGQAGAALASVLFDLQPTPERQRAAPKLSSEGKPGALALAAAAFRHDAAQYVKLARHLPDVVRTLAGMVLGGKSASAPAEKKGTGGDLWRNASFGPRTPLNVAVTPERSFAATTLPLAEVKAVARAQGATINDVVLALCSGALRRYLARHGGVPRKSLMATMPISLRDPGNKDFTTQATLSLVNLNTQIADPLKRLTALRASAGATKSVAKSAKSIIPTDFPSIGGPWILGALASLYGKSRIASVIPPLANVVISNVPGPQAPLYVAGARMTDYWPLSIVEHGVGLNITLMSYAGSLGVGFTAARCAVPDAQEVVDDFLAAHEELKRVALAEAAPEAKPRARPQVVALAETPKARKPAARAKAGVKARQAPAKDAKPAAAKVAKPSTTRAAKPSAARAIKPKAAKPGKAKKDV